MTAPAPAAPAFAPPTTPPQAVVDALRANAAGECDAEVLNASARYLAERGITPDLIASRGYRPATSTDNAALAAGFGVKAETLHEAALLYIPRAVLGQDGQAHALDLPQVRRRPGVACASWKPDMKFRSPHGDGPVGMIHPDNAAAVANTEAPLILTEGIVKADAILAAHGDMASLGVVAYPGVSIPAVRRGDRIGPRPGDFLATLRDVLDGRRVFLAFDGDWRTNANVAGALDNTAALLRAAGSRVAILDIPGNAGIDDYLAGASA